MAHRLYMGCFLPVMSFDTKWNLCVALVSVLVTGLLFARRKEQHGTSKLKATQLYGTSIAHETGDYLGRACIVGQTINDAIETKQIKPINSHHQSRKRRLYRAVPKTIVKELEWLGPELTEGYKQSTAKVKLLRQAMLHDIASSQISHYSIKDCVNKALEDVYFRQKEVSEGLKLHLEDDFKAQVLKDHFKHIIYNLVKNAYHHGRATQVTITLNSKDYTLRVRDNGKGIKPDVLPRVFDAFYTTGAGSGIGLGLVKAIVGRCGASIRCDSEMGEGSFTEFVIEFR